MGARQQLTLYDAWGRYLRGVSGFERLEATRVENDIGVIELTLDGASYSFSGFARDQILTYERSADGVLPYDLVGETLWRLRKVDWALAERDAPSHFVLTFAPDISLLNRPIAAFFAEEPETEKAGFGDDLMRAIVRENLINGSDLFGADAGRNRSVWLSVGPDQSLGAYIEKKFEFLRVLQVLQEIAKTSEENGTYLAFDMFCRKPPIQAASGALFEIEFKTWAGARGVDRRGPPNSAQRRLVIGPEVGNLKDVHILADWTTEETHVYAGGQGDGILRLIEEAEDAGTVAQSPFGRIEGWADQREIDTSAELIDFAEATLRGRSGRTVVIGQLVSGPNLRWSADASVGDIVIFQAAGFASAVRVISEKFTVDRDGGEAIQIGMVNLI